ncbi:MAG TPA: hypothetical protein VGU63_12870 [Candidatus Acidoferrales bacterium]|nr:hypothetical protein [Candidatus Acidoferrales bacterium]
MNALQRIAMGIGGTVAVALVFSLAAPKTVHAVVSALVTVANTAANPVPVSNVNEPALEAYQDFCKADLSSGTGDCAFQTIPAGKRLVIQDADISLAAATGARPYYVALFTPLVVNGSAVAVGHHLTAMFMGSQPFFGDWFETHQVVHLYVDPGQTPSCLVSITSTQTLGGGTAPFVFCNISGYMVNVP